MKINPNLIDLLKNNGLNVSDCIVYLLSLYFNQKPTYIPDLLKKSINTLNIFDYDLKNFSYTWNISLFENQITSFDWILDEYLPLFKPFGKDKKFKKECITRIEALVVEYPQATKDLILEATALYIRTCQEERRQPKHVTNPHYFIEKGKGRDKVNAVLTYIDLVKEARANETANAQRITSSNTIK